MAQDINSAVRIATAWEGWVAEVPVERSTLAILVDGQIVDTRGHNTAPGAVMPIASLSKAITSACAANVGLAASRDLAPLFGAKGPVTVRQLETHTSGIWPDTTQNNPAFAPGQAAPNLAALAAETLSQPREANGGQNTYNNLNYAVLGAAIEATSGASYGDTCQAEIFNPLGIDSAQLGHDWGHHGPWGGWALSAADFGRFADATFGSGSGFDEGADTETATEVAEGIYTQSGVLWTRYQGEHIVWSLGLLCWNDRCDGSYFARYGDRALAVVLFSGGLDVAEAHAPLDRALAEAVLAP